MDIIEKKEKENENDDKNIPLPNVGDTFMLRGYEYKVNYVNSGQKRFTSIPYKGRY